MFNKHFVNKYKEELSALCDYYKKQLFEDIIPFWEPRIVDKKYGGYFSCFDRKGVLYDDVKPGWFVGRNIYMFSNFYNCLDKKPEWLDIAANGVDFMLKHAYDGNGRFYSRFARDGTPLNFEPNTSNDGFVIRGYYEYLVAIGSKRTNKQVEFAIELSDMLFKNARNLKLLEKQGLPSKYRNHAVTFTMLLTALESRPLLGEHYTNELIEWTDNAMYVFAKDEHKAVFKSVGADGQPMLEDAAGRVMDIGHAAEACWFAMCAGMELNREDIIKRSETILDWVIDRGYDKEHGGFMLLHDMERVIPEDAYRSQNYYGTIADYKDKVWWVQAEGLIALALSALLTGNERHFSYFKKLHDYVDKYFRDREYGEWFSILSHDNKMLLDHKGFEGKGPYHVPRCIVMLYNLFKNC